jgi:hypothetical protein
MEERYAASDNIAAYCTKCKLTLDHIIVAVDQRVIAKVQCRTCGRTHRFRNAPGAPRPTGESMMVPTPDERWEAALAGTSGTTRPYSMDGKYRVGDVIVHDRFGKGVVIKLAEKKCSVVFKDQERLMAAGA